MSNQILGPDGKLYDSLEAMENARRARKQEEIRQRQEDEMRSKARHRFILAGGTDAEFTREWPKLRQEMLRERAKGMPENRSTDTYWKPRF